MKESVFMLCVLAVTVYLAVAAWEDHKTCEVTRWKHLVGGIPAVFLLCTKYSQHFWQECAMILAFAILFVLAGYMGAYGVADGLVFANLTLFFGSIGGLAGSGVVILIMIIAAFSFLISHVFRCVVKHKKIRNMAGALIPHILVGYMTVFVVILFDII